MKPLFIPLKTEYFEAFKRGEKTQEFRLYGKRWNEKTCVVGRGVTLSRGYGKKDRLCGEVAAFNTALNMSETIIYPVGATIAVISIKLMGKMTSAKGKRHPQCGYPMCMCIGECYAEAVNLQPSSLVNWEDLPKWNGETK